MDEYAIGLDLGTTYSCIGAYKDGKVEIIKNKSDDSTTPSIVILDNDANILVGEDATGFLVKKCDCCIYEIKRLIGRKYSDKEVQQEMEKLPFKIIKSKDDSPMVEMIVGGIPLDYNPVEISSFIIKKMVKTAEDYLKQKITKLVITVPAYFNDSQRTLTKQAAELCGLKVLRVINEPTAAALAYGFDNKNLNNEIILVFDLGGGTFDVSILSIEIDKNDPNCKVYRVLGTSGDTHLGGEDFDNRLVEYFLNKKDNIKDLLRNKEFMKDLKISCEKVKKILSEKEEKEETIFKNNSDQEKIIEKITRIEFEDICHDLFKKLEKSLDEALINAKLTKDDINDVILIGGSTRIPKVQEIVRDYFPKIQNIKHKINPDEAVAYGATLEAEKLLHNKDDSISNFLLMDKTPLSLGTNIINRSTEPEIRKEGDVMSVIIKKGTDIPTALFSKNYFTVEDNQTEMPIDIYEGENIFVKYNHLLAKKTISGLQKMPAGQTKVVVSFEIDINGILTVTAKEETKNNDGQILKPVIIKNDGIVLTPEKMKELEEKNQNLLKKIKNNDSFSKLDYSNLKGKLLIYKNAYEESEKKLENKNDDDEEEEDNRIIYLLNFNETLEDFLDLFDIDNNLDNETIFEKYYLYVKELFSFYIKALKLELDRGDKNHIITKIKEYINKFINKSSDYLNNLLEIFNKGSNNKEEKKEKKGRDKLKSIFYEIVIYAMEKLNEHGKKCIEEEKKFSKYYSLLYFEQAEFYYEKYLSKIEDAKFPPKELENKNKQKNIYIEYIKDINSGAIGLCYQSFKGGYIIMKEIDSKMTGGTNNLKILALGNIDKFKERWKITLSSYEKILSSIQNSPEFNENTKKEAICIANIIYINASFGHLDKNSRTLLRYAQRCQFIIENNKDSEKFKKEQWFIEFNKLYDKLKSKEPIYEEYSQISPEIKKNHEKIFKEIDEKYNKKNSKMEFINFILEKHPYKTNKDDEENINLKEYRTELVFYLLKKYHPDNYPITGDEETKLKYCIAHEITKKLNHLYITP